MTVLIKNLVITGSVEPSSRGKNDNNLDPIELHKLKAGILRDCEKMMRRHLKERLER